MIKAVSPHVLHGIVFPGDFNQQWFNIHGSRGWQERGLFTS
jgi:hypothetical protein